MLLLLQYHIPNDELASQSSVAAVASAMAGKNAHPFDIDDDGSVIFQNESSVWFFAFLYLCLFPFVHNSKQGNGGATVRRLLPARRMGGTTIWTALIPSVALVMIGVLWCLPSVQLILASFPSWYLKALEEHPLLTKSATTGLIQFVGDCGAQYYENLNTTKALSSSASKSTHKEVVDGMPHRITPPWMRLYDFRRGLSLFADGLVLSGPMLHYSYQWMEKVLPTGGGGWKPVVGHILIDDYILDATYITLSLVFTGISEGHGKELTSIFRNDYWPTMAASWCTNLALVPLEFFCFGYLSVQFRPLFMNFVDLLWNAVVSFMSHRSRRASSGGGMPPGMLLSGTTTRVEQQA